MKKFILLVTLLILCLLGCHQESAYITTVPTTEVIDYSTMAEKIGTTGNHINGTTSGNISMGLGTFSYSDGYIYFSDYNAIYEYSLESGITVKLSVEGDGWPPFFLYVLGDKIMFSGEKGIETISRDGKEQSVLYEGVSGWSTYIDGNDCYYLTAQGGVLCHRDFLTGVTNEYFGFVNTFFVTEDSIYACADEKAYDGSNTPETAVYVASREDMVFTKVETSENPIAVCVNGDDLFYAKWGKTWYIYHISDGVEEKLPIQSFYFQSIGEQIIYIDKNSLALKSYNWKTEEERLLSETVLHFCILEDRYVCLRTGDVESDFIMIDLYTDTVTDMLPEPEG